ncbi:MAG: proq activator of osmoprotectant transporter prop [Gammaproteobacteria bacterium]|nr:proq activator of osmoprotectant transporter prop [Gammaproteobacteria bacterium]MBU1507672.1 proq activator of osmoprotectant transporter prop [Gammaproteobacteria bacterium]MBU2121679.1 proq activator of osmoprotectant transporter prop [Gammaproteobacteria bacterium]MBU2172332.1 proq activator of osmoprotectant transporter prop [Gammaproteobacteria bacterium]MBU2203049.1 proq activator of osmoprotectant transporter prop [Gammaproteobacteria bacterium]
MTDSASAPEPSNAAPAAQAEAVSAVAAAFVRAGVPRQRDDSPRRSGSDRRRTPRSKPRAPGVAPDAAQGAATGTDSASRAPQRTHPMLEQLAALYPVLFGAVFRPLKRGIFQDLLAAHPDVFERDALKVALGIHTRSTRYLQSVAAGDKRHDLQGQPVEDMAPEHVHHALLEVYRRRKARGTDDLLPKLRNRMIVAFEASGLTREAYTELVQGRDETANAILEEAFAEWSARNAKDEALLRAFEASGQTLEAFADMYGMVARTVGQQLERARRRQAEEALAQANASGASKPADAATAGASEGVAEPVADVSAPAEAPAPQ